MAENEQEAVRTTIVGGRPPGSGRANGQIPRGIEVLTKKAAVDADFKALLLRDRAGAAAVIGLELAASEAAMLNVVPESQLEAIISRTRVQKKVLSAFLGGSAAAMLVALSTLGGCDGERVVSQGIEPDMPRNQQTEDSQLEFSAGERPDVPAISEGIRPDIPEESVPEASEADGEAKEAVELIKPLPEIKGSVGTTGIRVDVPPVREEEPGDAVDGAPAEEAPSQEQPARPPVSRGVGADIPPQRPAEPPAEPPADDAPQADQGRIKELIGSLGHAEFKVREDAEKQLVQIGQPAEPALREATGSDDPEVRFRANRALTTIAARNNQPSRPGGEHPPVVAGVILRE